MFNELLSVVFPLTTTLLLNVEGPLYVVRELLSKVAPDTLRVLLRVVAPEMFTVLLRVVVPLTITSLLKVLGPL